jgi:hypothetical protein
MCWFMPWQLYFNAAQHCMGRMLPERRSLCNKLHACVVAIPYARHNVSWASRELPVQAECVWRLSAHLDCQSNAWKVFRVMMSHVVHKRCVALCIILLLLTKHASMSSWETPKVRALGIVFFNHAAAAHCASKNVRFCCAADNVWCTWVILQHCAAANIRLILMMLFTHDHQWQCFNVGLFTGFACVDIIALSSSPCVLCLCIVFIAHQYYTHPVRWLIL